MHAYLLTKASADAATARVEQDIKRRMPDISPARSVEDILAQAKAAGPSFVLCASAGTAEALTDIIEAAAAHGPRLFFIVVGDEISVEAYKALTRSGHADWVSAQSDLQEIFEIMSRVGRRSGGVGEAASDRRAAAVSFIPSAGGVGNATLVVETAVALKSRKTLRASDICIVDLDFQTSHVCDYLDIEPRLQIEEISRDAERLDRQLFEIFISRHSSGLHVFAAPRSKFDVCGLDVAALDALFDMITARYDLMLLDLPATWFSFTPQIVAASDGVIVTAINTIPGLRQAADTMAQVRRALRPSGRSAVAINRCQRTLVGGIARRQHVESVLGKDGISYIGEDGALIEAANTGTPAMLSKASRAFAKDIDGLADFCAASMPAQKPAGAGA